MAQRSENTDKSAERLRLFFAIKPAADALAAIEELRHSLPLPEPGRAVPLANTHLTLAFLGDTPRAMVPKLKQAAAQLDFTPSTLVLDQTGWFRRSQVLWLGPSQVPDSLLALARALRGISAAQGLHTEQREFCPHVTLYRKARHRPDWPQRVPPVSLACRVFGLYVSQFQEGKTHYQALAEWP